MNVKIPKFVICNEKIIYLLLYNLHDYTFKVYRSVYAVHTDFANIAKTISMKNVINRAKSVN